MSNYRILGKNDEVTTCECCGKSNLKLTVILTDGEHEVRFGRDCAARALAPVCRNGKVVGSYLTALKVERMAEKAEYDRERADRMKTRLSIPNF